MSKSNCRWIALIACVLVLVRCEEQPGREELCIAFGSLPATLNPLLAESTSECYVADLLFDGLVNRTGAGIDAFEDGIGFLPVRPSDRDAKVYTMRINGSKTWHDHGLLKGHQVSADDVIFTWACLRRQQNNSPYSVRALSLIENIEHDPAENSSVMITFKMPVPPQWAPDLLSFFKIIPRIANGRTMSIDLLNDPETVKFSEQPVGSGPYKFTKRDENGIVLEAAGFAQIRKLRICGEPDPLKRVHLFKRGEYDIVFDIPYEMHDELIAGGIGQPVEFMPYNFYAVAINTRRITDVAARKGLAKAINRAEIIKEVLGAGADPQQYEMRIIYPVNVKYSETFQKMDAFNTYDPLEAKKEYENSSLKERELTLIFPTSFGETGKKIAELLRSQWARIGIRVRILTAGEGFGASLKDGNYELALVLEEGFDKTYAVERLYYSYSKDNVTGVRSQELDMLLNEFEGASQLDEQYKHAKAVNGKIGELVPYVYLFTLPTRMYYSTKLDKVYAKDPQYPLASLEYWKMR